jgi:toxin-antitoxin system PIN domain toxin
MIAIDTNVLIYAHRGKTGLHHAALAQLIQLSEGDAPSALPVFCVAEFFRVVTHRQVFNPPSTSKAATDFIDALRSSPTCRIALPGDEFVDQLRTVLLKSQARGNLAFDAQIAVLCREHGISSVLTNDRDFERVEGLMPVYLNADT